MLVGLINIRGRDEMRTKKFVRDMGWGASQSGLGNLNVSSIQSCVGSSSGIQSMVKPDTKYSCSGTLPYRKSVR